MASLLKPLRFRFSDPQDIADYGARWWRYDEARIIANRARVLMDLEQEMGLPIADVMSGVRASTAMGDMAGTWMAMKLDPDEGDKAPAFADYDPIVMMIVWEAVPAEELEPGKEDLPSGVPVALEPGGSPDQPLSAPAVLPDESATDAISETATVSLVTMPVSALPTS